MLEMNSRWGTASLPRPLRRFVNILRRSPLLSIVFGGRPMEGAVGRLYFRLINQDDVVVEVGARMGDATRTLAKIAKHVYSFEPSKSSFLVLKATTGMHRNVDVYNLALSDHSGDNYLYRDRGFSGVASLKKLNDVRYVSQEKVAVRTLDEISFRLLPTALIVDCEGSEYEVLRGGRKLLPNLRRVLVETHVLSDGSSTLSSVQEELGRVFPIVQVERVGNEYWVFARK